MGYTRNTGQLSYLITYDGSGNITVPASFTQTTVTSSMLKADSAGKLVAAVAGTDFVAPAGLSAYVPTTRTITINGTSYDLSADRSWSIVSGVSSFNTRTGAITLTDTDVTGALGYTPVTNARTLTINGTTYDLSANRSWTIVAGLSSFNTRTGDITLLDTDVTGALGYTPVTNARTITINGTTYDLSANRTWTVDTSSVTTRVIQKFTATASQDTFTVTGGYTVGMVDVFLNGVKLDNATEFTASNGSTVVLTAAAAVNDVVEVYKYGGQFIANNSLRQTTAFTATAGQTTFTVSYSVGFVDVFYNGSKLAAAEFTATNGTSIVLGTACVVNDIVEVVAYNYTVGAFTGVGGSGTTNYIPKWTASGTLGNSQIFDNGNGVGIGTTTINSSTKLAISAANTVTDARGILSVNSNNAYGADLGGSISLGGENGSGSTPYPFGKISGRKEGAGAAYSGYLSFATTFSDGTITERMRITSAGIVQIGSGTFTSANGGLAIKGSGGSPYISWHADDGTRIGYLQMQTSGLATLACTASGQDLAFEVNGAERMRLNSSGQIRITGASTTDAASAYLENEANNGYFNIYAGGSGISTKGIKLRVTTGSSTIDGISINSAGSVYFGKGGGDVLFTKPDTVNYSIFLYSGSNSNVIFSGGSGGLGINNKANSVRIVQVSDGGNMTIVGSLSKGSGSFRIDHPLDSKKDTHHLVHSFVESPQANNIYRGKVQLVNGSAQVNLDEVSTMTEGTFVLLNREIHTYTSNETDWDAVRGKVEGNILTIECQNIESNAIVSWLVIGERKDKHMMDTEWTDENGKVIVEPLKEVIQEQQSQTEEL
jgi:predicted heme/steroid binding protein